MRADQLLVERGLAATRSQAQRLIAAGVQWRLPGRDWHGVTKNGEELRDAVELRLPDTAETRYVSRGGLKLEGALHHTGLDVSGLRCLDVGQSSGGFTDCLLQRGAAQVVGVDVGQGQLHPRLRSDARVVCIEKCNARELSAEALAQAGGAPPFDLIVGDLSFISQTLVWPAILPMLAPAITTVVILRSVGIYNDFVAPFLYASRTEDHTVSMMLYQFAGFNSGTTEAVLLAAVVLVILPTLLGFFCLQRFIYSGITQGAVHG